VRTVTGAAILAEDLERRFGKVAALAKVSLAVRRGEIYGLLGPNGAGKSTFVRILCTLLRPTGGRALVAGHDVVREPRAVRLATGVALQSAALDGKQTGRELLRLQARLYGLRGREVDRRVDEVLGLVDIAGALDRRISTYSGGMQRRLDLAAALVHRPEVLFLDEPTTGLDPASRMAVWGEVRRLRSELGVTILLTTQYLEEADELADRVGILAGGRMASEGTPSELKRAIGADVVEVTVGEVREAVVEDLRALPGVLAVESGPGRLVVRARDGAALVSPLALLLARAGCSPHAITVREPTLDDVFLELTGRRREPLAARAAAPPGGRAGGAG
jgi:ABC-2 type transport system ATP-binding protein